ncbi:uncharacterized protein LOC133037132 [Cannabis sativa]|uniref:uncharacterized protein LOC133037132 n=1 Tax=Cannabis sativa TaxID=3483 RepID=UPI0029CA5C4B|nr:uncharacterized protein LOC133037132 [Cannabis sativa]
MDKKIGRVLLKERVKNGLYLLTQPTTRTLVQIQCLLATKESKSLSVTECNNVSNKMTTNIVSNPCTNSKINKEYNSTSTDVSFTAFTVNTTQVNSQHSQIFASATFNTTPNATYPCVNEEQSAVHLPTMLNKVTTNCSTSTGVSHRTFVPPPSLNQQTIRPPSAPILTCYFTQPPPHPKNQLSNPVPNPTPNLSQPHPTPNHTMPPPELIPTPTKYYTSKPATSTKTNNRYSLHAN